MTTGVNDVVRHRWPILPAIILLLQLCGLSLCNAESAPAAESVLVITNGAQAQRFTADQLAKRPDAVILRVAGDVSGDIYRHTLAYRAVPLLAILGTTTEPGFDTIETAARDGFASQIPLALINRGSSGGAIAYLAIEDPAHPWPQLPGSTETAGPFYLIWDHPERSAVTREQWPYQVTRITFVESPVHRWPQLAAPTSADALAQHGLQIFLTQCLPCHRINGGGDSDTGPDLGRPMNPTQYFAEPALRTLIRDPKSVRTWPEQRMIGFSKEIIPDHDLDALIGYLRSMAMPAGCSTPGACVKP